MLRNSASPGLLAKSSETYTGRIYYHELTSFTIKEIISRYSIEKLLLPGGFPLPFLAKTTEAKINTAPALTAGTYNAING